MTQYKFRAWDKILKVIWDDISFDKMSIYGSDWDDVSEQWSWQMPIFAGILMQFTGLKDKKGKEIYEGDIVKGGDCSGNFEVVFGEYYSECYSRHFGWKINTEWTEEFNWEKLEVIGNIYENPELTT